MGKGHLRHPPAAYEYGLATRCHALEVIGLPEVFGELGNYGRRC